MSDSNPSFPSDFPSDEETPRRKRPGRRDEIDDESIDLGNYSPVEESSAVLSFSGRPSGPTSGSSIVSWDELARAHSISESDSDNLDDARRVDFDAASDMDLLRQVLSKEPPPSQIILKDPSNPEMPALPSSADEYDSSESALEGFDEVIEGMPSSSASSKRLPRIAPSRPPADEDAFALPPELSAENKSYTSSSGRIPRAKPVSDIDDMFHMVPGGVDGSSILGPSSSGSGHSSVSSDLWGDSSRVDLLGNAKPHDVSSGSLQHTDEVDARPVMPLPDDSAESDSLLSDLGKGDDESSAVDLGSQAAVDLPFPLGLDSSVSSSLVNKKTKSKPSSSSKAIDSGTVDLLAGSSEFDLASVTGMSSVVRQLKAENGDLPPTVPLSVPTRSRTAAWVGGGLAGFLGGAAIAVGVWYAGFVPPSDSYPAATKSSPALVAAEERASKLAAELSAQKALADKARTAADEASKAKADLDRIREQLTAAKIAPADLATIAQRLGRADQADAHAKQANDNLAKLLAQLKAADLNPANLDGAAQVVAQAKTAAEEVRKARMDVEALTAKIRAAELDPNDLNGSLKTLKDARAKAEASVKEYEAKASALATSQAQLADVVAQVTARLQSAKLVGPNPKLGDVLLALDRALQPKPLPTESAAPRAVTANPITEIPVPNSKEGADQALTAGIQAIKDRDYSSAIAQFTAAAQGNPRDARAYYLLAIARMQIGQSAAAYQLLQQGHSIEPPGWYKRGRTRSGHPTAQPGRAVDRSSVPTIVSAGRMPSCS
ncbi:MAG: tetratricopeptide repeat protein [Gemmataceae bacterium]